MPTTFPDSSGKPQVSRLRTLLRTGRWCLLALAVLLIMAAIAWWALLFQILPRIGTWREALAQQATKALGVPVQIGTVSGHAEGWSPVLSLKEVALLDERGSVALRLPEVTARISPRSLWPATVWRQELHLDRLLLVRPELQVRRDASGDLHVAGLKLAPSSAVTGEQRVLDWVLSQRLIRIEQGTVRWTDELRKAPTLLLNQVDLDLSSRPGLGTQVHQLALMATPLPEFGQRIEVKARMTQPLWSLSPQEAASSAAGLNLPWWRRWFGSAPRVTDWATWSGDLTVLLPYADVQSLRKHVDLPVDVEGGRGRMGAALVIQKGKPSSLALDVDVQDVSIRMEKGLQPLAFRQLSGRITAQSERTVSRVALEKLAFTTAEGVDWPASSARMEWRHAPLQGQINADVWRQTVGGQVSADRLDLGVLARLADRLPISVAMRRTLADLAPQGVGRDLTWRWEGPADDPRQYQARGQIKDFGWAASAAKSRPGLAEADIDLKADEKGGQASLTINKGWVELPGAFDEPRIPLDAMSAKVGWRITPSGQPNVPPYLEVNVKKASFANDDAEGELQADWHTGPDLDTRYPGHLELDGKLAWGQANRVWRYLPSVIPFHARNYVRMAVREGRGEKVTFEVKGDLAGFPFKNDQGGRFRVHVPARNVTLDYVPAGLLDPNGTSPPGSQPLWPAFTGLDGDLVFEGMRLRIQGAKARLGSLGTGSFLLRDVEGRIENLAADDPHLEIRGQGQGPLNDLLRYMAVSPVGVWTGNLLRQAEGTGTGSLQLALNIPLNHTDQTGLSGRVSMAEHDQAGLRLHPGVPSLQKVRGAVDFTQKTLKVSAVANVWGQDINVEGQQDATGAPKFIAQGMVTAEGLRTASEWPALAQLAQRMTGQTPVTVTVALPKGSESQPANSATQPELQVVSTLQGLAVDLPAPLSKRADAVWPLMLTHRGDDPKGLSDALLVELGAAQSANAAGMPWLRADYRRDVSGAQPKVTRGALSLVQSTAGAGAIAVPTLPPKGVVAQVAVPSLDLDAWQGMARVVRSPSTDAVDPGEDYLPDTLSLRTAALNYQQRNLRDVVATLAHPNPGIWRAQIDSEQLVGQIELRPETSPLASGPANSRVVARLSRLSVPAAEAEALETQAAQQLQTPEPTTVPALDIVIEQFEWRGLPLGRMEVEAINRLVPVPGRGPQPEWRLNKLRMVNADGQLDATGNWLAVNRGPVPTAKPQQRASFDFTLDLHNSGGLLGRLGMAQTLKGGKGKLTGQVSWLGSPLEPNPPTMSGELSVDIQEGQFLKVDPGMAKLLGVLSLQSLPRRLVLDFRDVFQQGFAFDAIDGDVSIKQGVANTRNLRMRGVQAVVMMEGQADLARETQNLHVFVVPEVNAGTASLAYAVINPAIGLGTFIAQVLLRKQVAEASTRQFSITGSWADPQVERVERPLFAPVPGASQAAPAASAPTATKTPS